MCHRRVWGSSVSMGCMTLEEFKRLPFLSHVFEPLERGGARAVGTLAEVREALATGPDAFFEPAYTPPFEDWCVDLDERGNALERAHGPVGPLPDVYDAAWELTDGPEFASLVSDLVESFARVLAYEPESLTPMQRDIVQMLAAGRFPWGYEGDYPSGTWVVL